MFLKYQINNVTLATLNMYLIVFFICEIKSEHPIIFVKFTNDTLGLKDFKKSDGS